jgi:hypothetical protein
VNSELERHALNATAQRVFSGTGPVLIVLFFVGWVMSGLIPPPSPTLSAPEIVAKFTEHQVQTRIGCLIMMVGVAFYGTWTAVISLCIYRTEQGRFPIFAFCSMIMPGCGTFVFGLIPLTWAVASFRPGQIGADVTLTLNDWTFFMVLYSWPTFALTMLAYGWAILRDKNHPEPIFPRWLGYANLWFALLMVPGGMIGFTKTGPFAWDGIISFWVVVVAYFLWIVAMTTGTIRSVSTAERRLASINTPVSSSPMPVSS